ncbi:MAG: hypothetical protein IT289_05870 [Oligoflexia bacterium]|nr:hypothetical protein [Oligoflexia bacterium]
MRQLWVALLILCSSTLASAQLGPKPAEDQKKKILAVDDYYSFGGGACVIQGQWTQAALESTRNLIQLVQSLKDDKNCKGIESVVSDMGRLEQVLKLPDQTQLGNKLETLPSELHSLFAAAQKGGPLKDSILDLLGAKSIKAAATFAQAREAETVSEGVNAGVLVESALNMNLSGLATRATRATKDGAAMLSQFFNILPQYDQCLVGRPSAAAGVLGAAIRTTMAFSSSSEGLGADLSRALGGFATMLQQRKFSKVLRELAKTEYIVSLSCLLESLAQNHCTNVDNLALLRWGQRENPSNSTRARITDTDLKKPLAGYYILSRTTPVVTDWLQLVRLAARPRLPEDAAFKNTAWDTVTDVIKEINRIWGTYNEKLAFMRTLSDLESKKNYVFQMITDLTNSIITTREGGKFIKENFFTTTVQGPKLPFFLIGRSELPKEVFRTDGGFIMDWDKYIFQNGRYVEEFNAPDKLAQDIGDRLKILIDGALDVAGAYFRRFIIIDTNDLVVRSMIDPNFTVLEGFVAMYNYLSGFEEKLTEAVLRGDQYAQSIILPLLRDTKASIFAVVQEYEKVRRLSNAICKGDSNCLTQAQYRDDVRDAYMRVVDAAYRNFNAMFQRESFFTNRISTIVSYDYALRVRSGEKLNLYEQDLMRALGTTLLDSVMDISDREPSIPLRDLSWAYDISKRNLWSFELLFRDTFVAAIAELDSMEKNMAPTNYDLWKATQKRRMQDSNYWARIGLAPVTVGGPVLEGPLTLFNYFMLGVFHPERYPNYSWDNLVPRRRDDGFKSIAFTKARLCVQTLAFQDRSLYSRFCRGAVMEGFFGGQSDPSNRQGRQSLYDVSYNDYTLGAKAQGFSEDERICALRDGSRRNYIKWLSEQSRSLERLSR